MKTESQPQRSELKCTCEEYDPRGAVRDPDCPLHDHYGEEREHPPGTDDFTKDEVHDMLQNAAIHSAIKQATDDSVCPVCKGVPVDPENPNCHGCMECDFHGTFEGYQAMQRLTREAYEAAPATDDKQESANVHIEHFFPKGYNPDDEPWKSIRSHHNASLAASNRKYKPQVLQDSEARVEELEQQLLSAQAAIAEAIKQIERGTSYNAITTLKAVDLSALERHDAEVRKPLVEALESIRGDAIALVDARKYPNSVLHVEAPERIKQKANAAIADAKTASA